MNEPGNFAFAIFLLTAASGALVACSDDAPAVPRAYVESYVKPGTDGKNGAEQCALNSSDPWITVGTNATSSDDGTQFDGLDVDVECTVAPSGSGFDVSLVATLSAPNGDQPGAAPVPGEGSVEITSSTPLTSTGVQSNVAAKFIRSDTGHFESSNCTITYPDDQSIGAGRIRGTINCQDVVDTSANNRTCTATADFRFEYCLETE